MSRSPILLAAMVALALAVSAGATASNATLQTTLNTWSKKIGADARSVALAARQRHPRQMTTDAKLFHADAQRGRLAVSRQKPSTAAGRHARLLALTAFTDYALAGTKWAASGQARLNHHRAASIAYANAGAAYAHAADTRLITASKLMG